MIKLTPAIKERLFQLCMAAIAGFFLWSRLDFSDRIYYSVDGDVIVGLIRLMLQTHNWDADWNRLVGIIHLSDGLKPFIAPPDLTRHFYNLSGYTVIGAVFCKIIYAFGIVNFTIQANLHFLNLLFQVLTLLLLFLMGLNIANRYVGLLAVLFFTIFPLALAEAHYERPESWLCLLTTAIVYLSMAFEKNPKRNAAFIGILIGLSIVTKFSQIFLGIIPAILLTSHLFSARQGTFKKNLSEVAIYSLIILLFVVVAAFINTPFIFKNLSDYLFTIPYLQKSYASPTFPFASEHYSFFQQLHIIFYYFYITLGAAWLFCLAFGTGSLLAKIIRGENAERTFGLIIILPIAFLVCLFSLQVNYIERNFAPVLSLVSLLSAIGFYKVILYFQALIRSNFPKLLVSALLILVVFYPASKLGFLFVKNHIKQPSYNERIIFQNELKKDFHEFWIKNIYIASNILNQLPEPLDNPPRIYHVEDLNEYSTQHYLANLKSHGFIPIAEYCSDFYNLPPSDFTIYHARARNHYLIKSDQWPKDVAQDYFKTNCK